MGNWRASCYSILVMIAGLKKHSKTSKTLCYLDKTLLIPVCAAGAWENVLLIDFHSHERNLVPGQNYIMEEKNDQNICLVILKCQLYLLLVLIYRESNLRFSLAQKSLRRKNKSSWHLLDTNHCLPVTHYPSHWEGCVGSGAAANFLSYYPGAQAGKWVKINNFTFALLDLITARVNQDNRAIRAITGLVFWFTWQKVLLMFWLLG